MELLIDDVIELEVPDTARTTREIKAGESDTYRVFVEAVILAVSVEPVAGADIGALTGNIVATYSDRLYFRRSMVSLAEVDGADVTYDFSMQWEADDGCLMQSQVCISAVGDRAFVAHAAYPAVTADRMQPLALDLLADIRWRPSAERDRWDGTDQHDET